MSLPELPVVGPNPCAANGCSACCHDIEMVLTEADLERLRKARPGEDFWRQAEDGYLELRARDGPPARGGEGRPCWFLGADGRCGVHAARPEGCRLYPAMWDDGLRRAVLDEDYFPHTDGFTIPPGLQGAVRDLALRLRAERRRRLQAQGRVRPRHE